jgi:hypothetical protein
MNIEKKKIKKILRKDIKNLAKKDVRPSEAKVLKAKKRRNRTKRAISVATQETSTLRAGNSAMFKRLFTDRDAARLAWMLTVTDPFGQHSWAIPPIISPGIPLSLPRIYRYEFNGFAVANASGRVFIGVNADQWLPNASSAAATVPVPYYSYLGNSTANGGTRGYPVHYTSAAYVGCPTVTGSSGFSYPGPAIAVASAVTGLNFMQFPDNFINTQLNNASASGNAFQRSTCISCGLRARPVAPASGALVPQGTLLMCQQILGDTVQTNPAAASGTLVIGGADAYAYMTGTVNAPGALVTISDDMVSTEEWDVMEWPREGKERAWLTAAAIPNQSCSLGAFVPAQTGTSVVGYPQLAVLGQGMLSGQVVQFQAVLVYAFYGSVSYEVNHQRVSTSVPLGDLSATAAAAASHMAIGGDPVKPAHQAAAATAQTAVDAGELHPSKAVDWLKSGAAAIESATGQTLGDLVGEGLGIVAGLLL